MIESFFGSNGKTILYNNHTLSTIKVCCFLNLRELNCAYLYAPRMGTLDELVSNLYPLVSRLEPWNKNNKEVII